MCRDTFRWVGGVLTNWQPIITKKIKVHGKYCGQLSCSMADFRPTLANLKILGRHDAPTLPSVHPCLCITRKCLYSKCYACFDMNLWNLKKKEKDVEQDEGRWNDAWNIFIIIIVEFLDALLRWANLYLVRIPWCTSGLENGSGDRRHFNSY